MFAAGGGGGGSPIAALLAKLGGMGGGGMGQPGGDLAQMLAAMQHQGLQPGGPMQGPAGAQDPAAMLQHAKMQAAMAAMGGGAPVGDVAGAGAAPEMLQGLLARMGARRKFRGALGAVRGGAMGAGGGGGFRHPARPAAGPVGAYQPAVSWSD